MALADVARWCVLGLGSAVLGSRTFHALTSSRPMFSRFGVLSLTAIAGVGFYAVMVSAATRLRRAHVQLDQLDAERDR